MKKQTFIFSSAILIASAVVTKLIGALFRIPLANMLGGAGMGHFSAAYGIFMTVYAVSVTGLPTAVARLVAENLAGGHFSNIRRIKSTALTFFALTGVAFTIIMLIIAYPFCLFNGETETLPSVLAIAPSIFFCCITSVYRGYYEGLRNMFPTAVSQVIEGLIKLCAGLGLCFWVIGNPERTEPLRIFFGNCSIISMAAAAAVLGISLSSAAGTLFIIIRDKLYNDGISCEQLELSSNSICSNTEIITQLTKTAFPVALGALVTNLSSVIDLITVTRSLDKAVAARSDCFAELTGSMSYASVPNFMYGSFTGLAVTVFNLIPSLTNMFGKGIFPVLSEAFAANDIAAVKQSSEKALISTAIISIPSGLGIMTFSESILHFLFSSRPLEADLCTGAMSILGIAVIFLCLSSTIFSVLQACGRAELPVKIMMVGVVIKLIGNIILVPIPKINISGAAIATLMCYIFIFFASIYYMVTLTDITKQTIFVKLCKLCHCSVMCCVSAKLVENLLSNALDTSLVLFISIFIGVIFYILCGYLLGIFTKSTLKLLIS